METKRGIKLQNLNLGQDRLKNKKGFEILMIFQSLSTFKT
jgi:hypothetical protein